MGLIMYTIQMSISTTSLQWDQHTKNQGIQDGASSVGKPDFYTKENDDYKQTPFYLGNNPNFINNLNDVDVNKTMDTTESNNSLAGMHFTTEDILGKKTKK